MCRVKFLSKRMKEKKTMNKRKQKKCKQGNKKNNVKPMSKKIVYIIMTRMKKSISSEAFEKKPVI